MSHVLIVDDEANIRRMIRKYAEFYEHQVSEAANGIEAVELCRRNSYDVIVMDIMMPELDGFSAAAEILKHERSLYLCCPHAVRNMTRSTGSSLASRIMWSNHSHHAN